MGTVVATQVDRPAPAFHQLVHAVDLQGIFGLLTGEEVPFGTVGQVSLERFKNSLVDHQNVGFPGLTFFDCQRVADFHVLQILDLQLQQVADSQAVVHADQKEKFVPFVVVEQFGNRFYVSNTAYRFGR